ncbi:hypothetical protein DTO013E5_1311 [Penicillium roqueforti]|uniref:uncharacterized protein n=1 Tax=Penicillium roqueforti TaxID=5082 RepID=UPI00190AF426|nr:uncharacterized protein LCP9604111_2252 [Penicillium roqueforti]KAF9252256.1 hypothetical protein LCP9604111_2252 [Penicillium roqueforti]KAI2747423.1 hypothetical protein DTO012A1_69 [Penicillium roqueforti]KAI2750995.1 hypothetical protein DTO013F2_4246 [Penicillium roqueforti]KAI2775057.1 hypothetical protein DTO012A8_542 [Penicillium roqueforti]KAI3083689.1 hypothetical protein CBS147339_2065 [Penicillium roqueforti]
MAQQEDASPRPFNPRPFCPNPLVIKPEQRIEQLKKFLEDPTPKIQRQRTNIEGLIRMTQQTIWICKGQIMDPPPRLNDLPPIMVHSAVWAEGIFHQLMQQSPPQVTTSKQ